MGAQDEARELAALVSAYAEPHAEAEDAEVRRAAAAASLANPFGLPGRRLPRRSPFLLGYLSALGVAAAVGLAHAATAASSVLTLLLVAGFLAVGLDAPVQALEERGWSRRRAVVAVLGVTAAVLVGFVVIAIPAIQNEYQRLGSALPAALRRLQARHDLLGRGAQQVHLSLPSSVGTAGLISTGRALASAALDTLTVVVLTCYLLASLPDIKRGAYRLVPRSRRARVGLLSDEILRRVGGYLLGNLITSAVAGAAMFGFLLLVGVPDPAFLGLLVALFDLIPMIGAPVAGVLVTLVALSVSVPVAIGTAAFIVVFRGVEDYLLSPRVMRRTVEVAPILTVVSVLCGGALLGIVGALIAVPVAASIDLIRKQVLQPRLDEA